MHFILHKKTTIAVMMLCSTNNELCCSLFPLKLDSARLYCQRNPHKSKHLFTQLPSYPFCIVCYLSDQLWLEPEVPIAAVSPMASRGWFQKRLHSSLTGYNV